MTNDIKPDISCVPYRRKGIYFAITIPFVALLILTCIYLWTYSFVLSIVFVSFYLTMCYFQSYCCAYQNCPYVGGFCPAIVGIMPSSILTKYIYGKKKIIKSKRSFEIHATLAFMGWLGMILFPLFWIARLGISLAVGYVACHVIYYLIFGLTICPVCAVRRTCPGGKLQSLVLKR